MSASCLYVCMLTSLALKLLDRLYSYLVLKEFIHHVLCPENVSIPSPKIWTQNTKWLNNVDEK